MLGLVSSCSKCVIVECHTNSKSVTKFMCMDLYKQFVCTFSDIKNCFQQATHKIISSIRIYCSSKTTDFGLNVIYVDIVTE